MFRILLTCSLLMLVVVAMADSTPVPTPEDEVEALATELEATISIGEETDEEIAIDAEGSLDLPEIMTGRAGWSMAGDIRGLGAYSSTDERDGNSETESDILLRARFGGSRAFGDQWRIGVRAAAACTSESCAPNSILEEGSSGSTDNSLDIDEAFVHWYQSERFDLAVGRLQTRFITKGGVFAKSLDRNDSNNTRITWTDGAHGTVHHYNGWESHLILQHNPDDGPAQVLRDPLDFSSSDSRVSAFFSIISEEPVRFVTQRAFDISYYPSALKKDGLTDDSRVEDYWGFVARIAGRYPKRARGMRLRFSAEAGYAPETPSKSGVDLSGDGDTDGFAGAITLSLMDFAPGHNIGVNVAHTEAGWLLSPQYNKNERLIEARWVWVATPHLTVDARVRHREDLERLTGATRRRQELDAFVRLTWRFRADWPTLIP